LYSVWGIVLQRYTNGNDVLFGTTVSGRTAGIKKIEDIVGLFINTPPLRVTVNPGDTPHNLVSRINGVLQQREEFESTSLVDIAEYSDVGHRETLFNTIVVSENYPLEIGKIIKDAPFSIHSYTMQEMTEYELLLGIRTDDEITVDFSFPGRGNATPAIKRLARHFTKIL
ncbi:MAG: hypothetical protein GY765_28450, partial [bacterium]|nr:hypothetical protein [bacterium]